MQRIESLYGSRYGGASQSKSTMPGNLSRPEPKPTTQTRHGYASHSQKQMEKSRSTPERKEDRYVPGNIVAPKPEPKPQTKQDFMRESEEKSRNSRSSGGGLSSSGGFGSLFGGLFG